MKFTILFLFVFLKSHTSKGAGIISLKHRGNGCCGQQQQVFCNATETNMVEIMVGRNVNEMFASNGGVVVIDGFAINLTTTPHPSIDDLFEFNVEILYMIDASTRNLNVTCATATVSNMISIVANSTPCTALPNKSPYTTVTSSDSGNYNVVVVTGISNDQETMCNITLECQQCFPNSKIEHNIIEPCASSNTFCDVAKGTYTLTTTVFNSCGETFAIEPSHEIIVGGARCHKIGVAVVMSIALFAAFLYDNIATI